MLLASLVAENPEREQVIYAIFSPENLISFDEVWSVIEGFGNEYFIDIYKRKLQTDQRPRMQKFFNYFIGKLYLAEGEEDEAIRYFNAALADDEMDDRYHTMLKARVYEGLALASSGSDQRKYTQQFYDLFPQLVPFSDLNMSFQLSTEPTDINEASDIITDLKQSNINWTNSSSVPVVSVSFARQNAGIEIKYSVEHNGATLQNGSFFVTENDLDTAGKLLAYRLFGIHKSRIGERPAPEPVKEEKKIEPGPTV
jgi:tetratricopeptide (TPR) repeat protein